MSMEGFLMKNKHTPTPWKVVKCTEEDVKHKLDCVVLVARDLLTGAKGN